MTITNLNSASALSEKHNAPEHHRVKPQQYFHRAFHELSGHRYCTRCGAINFKSAGISMLYRREFCAKILTPTQ